MQNTVLKIMLIEDSAEDAQLVREMLDDRGDNFVLKRSTGCHLD